MGSRERLLTLLQAGQENEAMETTAQLPHRDKGNWITLSQQPGNRRLNRRSVLIADDQADSVQALAIILEWSGHEVHVALDGREALDVAAQYRPELIFLDIAMPELNGYDVCRRLRNMPDFANARIYAMSAFTGELHETRCAEAGFTGRLDKPIDPLAIEQLAH
jgi:CheY-like chemotaxis protein